MPDQLTRTQQRTKPPPALSRTRVTVSGKSFLFCKTSLRKASGKGPSEKGAHVKLSGLLSKLETHHEHLSAGVKRLQETNPLSSTYCCLPSWTLSVIIHAAYLLIASSIYVSILHYLEPDTPSIMEPTITAVKLNYQFTLPVKLLSLHKHSDITVPKKPGTRTHRFYVSASVPTPSPVHCSLALSAHAQNQSQPSQSKPEVSFEHGHLHSSAYDDDFTELLHT